MTIDSVEHCDVKKDDFKVFNNLFHSNQNIANKKVLIIGSNEGEWFQSPRVLDWFKLNIDSKTIPLQHFTLHRIVIGKFFLL